jgi:glycosyltransferase involved in cell wall biosynthesis
MHILFLHKLFPAQFGQVARYLIQHEGATCTYVCERLPETMPGVGRLSYMADFAAGVQLGSLAASAAPATFQFSTFGVPQATPEPTPAEQIIDGIRVVLYDPLDPEPTGFDGQIARAHTVYQTLRAHPEIKPDLVVGPCIYASSMFLPDLYRCPVINYLDYYYRREESYVDFRPEFPPDELDICRARAHNALVMQDLDACAAAYSPTEWQRSLFPEAYQHKISTIFDGIDRSVWSRRPSSRQIGNHPPIPPNMRVVTFVARGLEALRGFDIFMKVAGRIAAVRSDVVFVVVGSENFYHGADLKYIRARSFLEHVLQQDTYDLSRFIFAGRIPSAQLVDILSMSDLHFYLTAPFVLSWSLFDALACGCTVLASDTAPVRELIRHEETGLLAGFFDVEELTRLALAALDEPEKYRPLAEAGVRLIDAKYSLERTMPELVKLFRAWLPKRYT